MFQRRGFCKKCYNESEGIRIFNMNDKHSVVYCPFCGAEMTNEEAFNNYNDKMNELYQEGELYLFKACDYDKAFEHFSYIISLDENDIYARYSKVLALLYSSTLRDTKFEQIADIFKEEKTKYFRNKNFYEHYLSFLQTFESGLEQYISFMKKNLTYKKYFYNFDCISLYFLRLQEINNLMKIVASEAKFLSSKDDETKFTDLYDHVQKQILGIQLEQKNKIIDIDGNVYKFGKIGLDGKPLIGRTEMKHYFKKKLPKKQRSLSYELGVPYIPNEVFKNKRVSYQFDKISFPTIISSITLFVLFLILFFAVKPVNYIFIVLSGLFLIVCVASFILRLMWKFLSKLHHYSSIKPFRRK